MIVGKRGINRKDTGEVSFFVIIWKTVKKSINGLVCLKLQSKTNFMVQNLKQNYE